MSIRKNGQAPPEPLARNGTPLLWPPSNDERDLLALVINDFDAATRVLPTLNAQAFVNHMARRTFEACCAVHSDAITYPTLNPSSLSCYCESMVEDDAKLSEVENWLQVRRVVEEELCQIPSNTRDAMKEAEVIAERLRENIFDFSTDTNLDDLLGSIEWLWPGYIPRGFVTGLVAEQDAGKSTVAQDFCRTLLCGGHWPDGQTYPPYEGQLLWIDTDGNLPLFHQRLKAWKMPRGRFIFPPDALQELSIDTPAHWNWIEQAVKRFAPPLVVIDALSGSHNGKSNDEDSMKVIMKRLHTLAQTHKIAVVVIHHLNKVPFGVPTYPITIDRLRGSGAISQLCRSILALATPDPTQPDTRRLDVIKLNLAQKPPALGYKLTNDGPAWGKAPEPPKQRRAADDAADFLRVALAKGKRPSEEVAEEAKERGIGMSALNDAKKALGIIPKREGGKDGRWFLSLEAEAAEEQTDP